MKVLNAFTWGVRLSIGIISFRKLGIDKTKVSDHHRLLKYFTTNNEVRSMFIDKTNSMLPYKSYMKTPIKDHKNNMITNPFMFNLVTLSTSQ